jgi:hypothetical protein
MSENNFDDFNFDDEPLPVMTTDTKTDTKTEEKQDLEDEDLKPLGGLDLLDNVSIDIPTSVAKKEPVESINLSVSKHEKDILSNMISDDTEEQVEIQRLMSDRRALSIRLENDPEFDKRYKRAEREYFDRVNGTESIPDTSVPNDELYKQAQALVERLHNKTGKPEISKSDQDPNDPHGLSRFGEVLHDIPDDSDEIFEKPDKTKSNQKKSSSKQIQKIVIKNAQTINIYYNK